jgi:small subunit ribosomal protein S6
MFLLDSNKYATNPDGTAGEVLAILERVGAKVLASRPWQDAKLAYLIEGHRRGMYFLTYFTLDTQHLQEVIRLCKFNETILRHLFIKLDPALVEPMVAMASGRGDVVVTSFRDPDSNAPAPAPAGAPAEAVAETAEATT